MTVTAVTTLKSALNNGNPNQLGDIAAAMKLGTMLAGLTRTFTGLASSATQDLTAIDATGETVGASNANRRGALSIGSVRVTAGAAAAGPRQMTDAGGTASATVAKISADGKTITFEAGVTAFVINYVPSSAVDMAAAQSAYDGAP